MNHHPMRCVLPPSLLNINGLSYQCTKNGERCFRYHPPMKYKPLVILNSPYHVTILSPSKLSMSKYFHLSSSLNGKSKLSLLIYLLLTFRDQFQHSYLLSASDVPSTSHPPESYYISLFHQIIANRIVLNQIHCAAMTQFWCWTYTM